MKLNKTYMAILSTISFGCLFSYADINEFNVIISQDKSNYKVTDWIDTGNTRCNTISPLAEEIYKDKTFTQYHSNCEKEQQKNSDIRWVAIDDHTEDKNGTLLLHNCSEILDGNHGTTSGVYEIKHSTGTMEVQCDMVTDGGGWTLVAYAGTINTDKKQTTGNTESGTWQPLFFNFGEYQKDATSSRVAFSRFDIFKGNSKVGDEFLSKRTSNNNKMLIFPIVYTSWWGRDASEGHFSIDASNDVMPYLKLTNSGNSNWKTVTNLTTWFRYSGGRTSGTYPGIDWNNPTQSNAHTGNNYNTNINHRALLYWESNDYSEDYSGSQWFHAKPLQMADTTDPENTIQDIEFWYRAK